MSSTFFNGPRVHFARNALAHAGRSGRRVSAFTATAFAEETADTAKATPSSTRATSTSA